MWNPPALCRNCGQLSNGPGFQLAGNIQIKFQNSRSRCPYCGGVADILDGTYGGTDEILSLLSGPQSTIDILRRAAQVVRDSQAAGETAEQTATRVAEVLPGFDAFKAMAGKKAISILFWLLGAVATKELVDPALDYMQGREAPVTVVQMKEIFKNEMGKALAEERKEAEAKQPISTVPPLRRPPQQFDPAAPHFPKAMEKLQGDLAKRHPYQGVKRPIDRPQPKPIKQEPPKPSKDNSSDQ